MSVTPQSPPAYDEFIEFIVKSGGPESVLTFKPSEATQNRAYELIDKEREGGLDTQEKAELNHYRELDHLFAMAKIRARVLLADKTPKTAYEQWRERADSLTAHMATAWPANVSAVDAVNEQRR